jgi:molybdopterin-guanine dinucleotide biosynthesis protein A
LATVAVDTPLFPENLVAVLRRKAGERIVAAESATGLHPTFALWPVSAEPELASWLASGQSRRMTDFLKSQSFETAMFSGDAALDPFFNINTPEDLAALSGS